MKARLGSNTSQKDEHTQVYKSGLAPILVPPSVGKEDNQVLVQVPHLQCRIAI